VKRLVTIVAPAILMLGLIPLGVSDTDISVADTSIPENNETSTVVKAGNSSASSVITITMHAVDDE